MKQKSWLLLGICFWLGLFSSSASAFVSQQQLKEKLRILLSQNHQSVGYDTARKFLMGQLHLKKQGSEFVIRDVYCLKEFGSRDFKSRAPGPGQIPQETILNTEHTWPQSKFGGRGPKDVQKSDLHHLFPSDNQMNSIRGNNAFGEVNENARSVKCPESRLGRNDQGQWIFEPPQEHQGNVARAMFYFSIRYQIQIDDDQERFLRKWNMDDPVDEFEIKRNDEIEKIQGNRNAFIDHQELVDKVEDF